MNENKLPDWVKEIDEDTFEVSTKNGTFKVCDLPYTRMEAAMKRSETTGKFNQCILTEAIIAKDGKEERIGEMEIDTYKSSTVMRLMYVINEVIGLSDFQKGSRKE